MDPLQPVANEMARRRILAGEDSVDVGNAVFSWLFYSGRRTRHVASTMANEAEMLAVAERDGFAGQEVA